MIALVATDVIYFSAGDEDSFFAWLKKIGCVKDVRGQGRDLLIDIDESNFSDSDLQELLALFHRYGIEMRQLRQFVTDKNAHWFRDGEQMYWHDAVFHA